MTKKRTRSPNRTPKPTGSRPTLSDANDLTIKTKRTTRPKKKLPPRGASKKRTAEEVRATIGDYIAQGLTLLQARFATEYLLNGLDPIGAYHNAINGKVNDNTASANAYRLLELPKIKAAVSNAVNDWLGEKRLKMEREIIQSLYNQAFYDPALFITPTGSPRFADWEEIPEEWRVCVKEINTRYYGKDNIPQTTLTLVDRNWAMEKLSRYVALFAPDNVGGPHQITNNVILNRIDSDAQARLAAVFAEVQSASSYQPKGGPITVPSTVPEREPEVIHIPGSKLDALREEDG